MAMCWLITWEWVGEHDETKDEIACILNYRLGGDRVRWITELLYATSKYSLSERVEYARKKFNPYPAEFEHVQGVQKQDWIPWRCSILCGHNPWLHARLVDDLHVEIDDNGAEKLIWRERPKPNFARLEKS